MRIFLSVVLWSGRSVEKGKPQLRRVESFDGVHIGDVDQVQLRVVGSAFVVSGGGQDDDADFFSPDEKLVRTAAGRHSKSIIASGQCGCSPVSLSGQRELAFIGILRVPTYRQSAQCKSGCRYLRKKLQMPSPNHFESPFSMQILGSGRLIALFIG